MSKEHDRTVMDRRKFLQVGSAAALGGAAFLGGALPGRVFATVGETRIAERALSFFNTHTQETVESVFWHEGEYIADGLAAINRVLRDHRTDEIKTIDVDLLDLLFDITRKTNAADPLQIISGYRSPRTNAQLRRQGRGVARKSYHMKGKAVDIRIPDVSLSSLKRVAIAEQRGGVGYYPRAGFVHVDTGPVRTW
jgi:uncharacterized protein YcbK (DUF882 family)